jgi:hypothetical protein
MIIELVISQIGCIQNLLLLTPKQGVFSACISVKNSTVVSESQKGYLQLI